MDPQNLYLPPHIMVPYKYNKWDSHPETLHEDRMRFIKMIEEEKNSRKQQYYGPSSAGNEWYQPNNDQSNDKNNDRSGNLPSKPGRESYQEKRARARGRSCSHNRSISHMRSHEGPEEKKTTDSPTRIVRWTYIKQTYTT
jgi:hypothetical protein